MQTNVAMTCGGKAARLWPLRTPLHPRDHAKAVTAGADRSNAKFGIRMSMTTQKPMESLRRYS